MIDTADLQKLLEEPRADWCPLMVANDWASLVQEVLTTRVVPPQPLATVKKPADNTVPTAITCPVCNHSNVVVGHSFCPDCGVKLNWM